MIGVTGTNGKSSVVWILTRMLEEGGLRVAASSSIEFQIAGAHQENRFKMTMPGRWHVQQFLRDAVRAGCTHAVLEVTSEGIAQHRHRFVDFDAAVFLNLAPEHIERHGGYANYRAAKGKLFAALSGQGFSVVNLADKEAQYFLKFPAERYLGFHLMDHRSTARLPSGATEAVAEGVRSGPHGVQFTLDGVRFSSPLRGTTNVENLLVSAALARAFGVPLETSASLAANLPDIPGRLEAIPNNRGIRIVVDYAHTPSALERVYQSVRNDAKQMICVLGAAGGGRDSWKRPELGAIAGTYCDVAIVADEDPYDETPKVIRDAVLGGIQKGKRTRDIRDIADRKAAIAAAIAAGKPGDAVVITGKGCEPWMMLAAGKKIPWDDRDVVRDALTGASE